MLRSLSTGSLPVCSLLAACAAGLVLGCSEGAGESSDDGNGSDDSADDGAADDADDDAADDDSADDGADDDAADDGAADDTSPGEGTPWIDPTEAQMATPGDPPDPPQVRLNDEAEIVVDEEEGNPAPSLRIEAPFSDYDQYIEIEYNLPGEDLSGKVLEMPLLLRGGGGDPNCPSGIQFYVKTGDAYVWAEGGWVNAPSAGIWSVLVLNLASPKLQPDVADQYDPTDVRVVGVRFNTGDCGGAPDGKIPPLPATYFIDTLTRRDATEAELNAPAPE